MSKETTATALTVEQEQAQAQAEKVAREAAREARLNQIENSLKELFPDYQVERSIFSIQLVSNSDSFCSSDLAKISAIANIYGNGCYCVSASVARGMRAIMY